MAFFVKTAFHGNRNSRTRTDDLLVPGQAPCQTGLYSVNIHRKIWTSGNLCARQALSHWIYKSILYPDKYRVRNTRSGIRTHKTRSLSTGRMPFRHPGKVQEMGFEPIHDARFELAAYAILLFLHTPGGSRTHMHPPVPGSLIRCICQFCYRGLLRPEGLEPSLR